MTGFRGQKFDFTGTDGEWYCLLDDAPAIHLNMRVTSPDTAVPQITYITGVSLLTIDTDGTSHTIVIEVSSNDSAPLTEPSTFSLRLPLSDQRLSLHP